MTGEPSAPLRVGIVGVGAWGRGNHLPALTQLGAATIVALCDTDPQARDLAQAEFAIPFATGDYAELLAQDLDALVVSSPPAWHAEQALAGLQSGRHVLVEKPIAEQPADAWRLVRTARRRGLHLAVPLGWNFWPPAARARELISGGAIGRLELMSVHMASPMRRALVRGARRSASSSGGYAFSQLTHALGLALWLLPQRPTLVSASCARERSTGIDVADAITVQFRSGAVGSVSGAAFIGPGSYHHEVRLYGSHGFLAWDAEVGRERLLLQSATAASVDEHYPAGSGAYDGRAPVSAFVDLCLGTRADNPSPGEVSAIAIELLDAAMRSSRLEGAVRIGP